MEKFKELIVLLYESRDKASIYHITVDSHSHHLAFDDYSNKIVEYIDTLIEMYIGKYGNIGDFTGLLEYNKETDYVKYFQELVSIIENGDFIDVNDNFLQSVIDEIIGFLYKTIYKLKYLK